MSYFNEIEGRALGDVVLASEGSRFPLRDNLSRKSGGLVIKKES